MPPLKDEVWCDYQQESVSPNIRCFFSSFCCQTSESSYICRSRTPKLPLLLFFLRVLPLVMQGSWTDDVKQHGFTARCVKITGKVWTGVFQQNAEAERPWRSNFCDPSNWKKSFPNYFKWKRSVVSLICDSNPSMFVSAPVGWLHNRHIQVNLF